MKQIACDITQVGRRWFKVEILEPIEGSLSFYEIGEVEASYSNNYWEKRREWTLTGIGSKKHRPEIIEALENHLEEATHG